MGMSIEEIIQDIEVIKAQAEWDYPLDWQIVLDGAIEIMRKYQKIEEIYSDYLDDMDAEKLADKLGEVF